MPFESLSTHSREDCIPSQDSRAGFYAVRGKRIVDVTLSALLLLACSPLLLLTSIAIKITSPGRLLYLQDRVGRGGQLFKIIKFRSMVVDADVKGPGITCAGDTRVTKVGRVLRKLKIDELPQLWNVFKGDMSLVGPRPELPTYVASYDSRQKQVLAVRPGITDTASIAYRWEEELLSQSSNPELFYREVILPKKLDLNLSYISHLSFAYDARVLIQTAVSVLNLRTRIGVEIKRHQ